MNSNHDIFPSDEDEPSSPSYRPLPARVLQSTLQNTYRNFRFDPYQNYPTDTVTIENEAYVLRTGNKIWTFVRYSHESSFAFSRNVRDQGTRYDTYAPPDEFVELNVVEKEQFTARINDFLLKKKQESERKERVLATYTTASEILLPSHLDNVFVDPRHDDTSLENLAISYSIISAQYRQGLQLFEVPTSDDNCKAYCGNG